MGRGRSKGNGPAPPFCSAKPSVDAHTSARRVQKGIVLCDVEELLAQRLVEETDQNRGRPSLARVNSAMSRQWDDRAWPKVGAVAAQVACPHRAREEVAHKDQNAIMVRSLCGTVRAHWVRQHTRSTIPGRVASHGFGRSPNRASVDPTYLRRVDQCDYRRPAVPVSP